MPLLCERLSARDSVIHTSKYCINKQRKRVQMSSPSSLSCSIGTNNTEKHRLEKVEKMLPHFQFLHSPPERNALPGELLG